MPRSSTHWTSTPTSWSDTASFLLFGRGQGHPFGGLGDLLGTFAVEQEARDAFRRLRLSASHADA